MQTGAELIDACDAPVVESEDVVLLEHPLARLGMQEVHSSPEIRHACDLVRVGLEDVDRREHVEELTQPHHRSIGTVDLREATRAEIAEAEVVGQQWSGAVVVASDERVEIAAGNSGESIRESYAGRLRITACTAGRASEPYRRGP